MRPPASLSNRISYRAVMCVSISRSRPVITTHGSVSNRINSQTPVGGPTQLSGVLWEIISQPLFRHHTHTHTHTNRHAHTQPYLREVKSEQTWCMQIWSMCKCPLRGEIFCVPWWQSVKERNCVFVFVVTCASLHRRARAHSRGRAGRSEHLSQHPRSSADTAAR